MTLGIAASVFIHTTMGILGVSRKDDHDDWGLPGGKVSEGETPVEGAIRELHEETGYVVEPDKLVEIFRGPARTPGRVMIVYRAEDWCKRGEPGPGEGKVAWITWSDLERGSFGDFHKVFHQQFLRHEEFVQSLQPLLRRVVQQRRPEHAVEDDVAFRCGISVFDAIRLIGAAVRAGVLIHPADSPGCLEPSP